VSKNTVLTFDDVELPAGRVCDRLGREQLRHFGQRAPSTIHHQAEETA